MKKGSKHSEEAKRKIREARARQAEPHLGHKHSEETKRQFSIARMGKKYSLGRILSEETKRKLRVANLGKQHTKEARENMVKVARRGENHHNWNGGISTENLKIRDSLEMKRWRKQVFSRDGFTCQACGQVGGKLQADHELPFALFPDLRFEILNGRALCVPCHRKIPTNNKAWKMPEYTT